jgi:hypothetical protein
MYRKNSFGQISNKNKIFIGAGVLVAIVTISLILYFVLKKKSSKSPLTKGNYSIKSTLPDPTTTSGPNYLASIYTDGTPGTTSKIQAFLGPYNKVPSMMSAITWVIVPVSGKDNTYTIQNLNYSNILNEPSYLNVLKTLQKGGEAISPTDPNKTVFFSVLDPAENGHSQWIITPVSGKTDTYNLQNVLLKNIGYNSTYLSNSISGTQVPGQAVVTSDPNAATTQWVITTKFPS